MIKTFFMFEKTVNICREIYKYLTIENSAHLHIFEVSTLKIFKKFSIDILKLEEKNYT